MGGSGHSSSNQSIGMPAIRLAHLFSVSGSVLLPALHPGLPALLQWQKALLLQQLPAQ